MTGNHDADGRAHLRDFTLHVEFVAADLDEARQQVEQYALALNMLRPEVDPYTARLSLDSDCTPPAQVFCLAPGPDRRDMCIRLTGHTDPHHGHGITGTWTNAEVPRAPDTIAGLD